MIELTERYLLTGGAGFIGSNLVDTLIEADADVSVIDDFTSGMRLNLDTASDSIVLNEHSVTEDMGGMFNEIDTVFHLAANVFISKSLEDPCFDANINVLGTINLLEECRRADVRRVVFASSSAVYGDPVRTPISEEHPIAPKSPYAASKLAGEHYMGVYNRLYGLETICLRLFNVYGPRQRFDSPYSGVVAQFCEQARRGEPLVLYGDGSQTRDFVNVKDVVNAFMAASTSSKAPGNAYNVGRGEPTSIKDLAGIIINAAGSSSEIVCEEGRPGDVSHSLADITAAKRDLGYKPSVELEKGIDEILNNS